MKKFIFAGLIGLMSFGASAGSRTGFIDISDNGIQLISSTAEESRLYVYDVAFEGGDCDVKTTGVLYFSTFLAKEMYSMLLTAKAAGKKIELVSSECVSIGGAKYPSISSIYWK
ncbi:hypothetical protein [Shewanella sp. YLB-07]|uniref:hypothetical protein n=1 Tax=Shewanella sp. YLB-07 TaxID=2601268 RepID=UPI00128D6215|nr:hypothetical protein [Shewanella sp. YLB-07]MPY24452.1 hypothetical protein [Shewanella sp. YLB-07]